MSLRIRFILAATVLVLLAVGAMGWFAVETIGDLMKAWHVDAVADALTLGVTTADDDSTRLAMTEALGTYQELAALQRPKRRELIVGAAALAFFLTAVSIGASWFVATRWTRPIRELAKATISVSGGKLDEVEHTGGAREAQALVHSFNRMVRSLRESRQRLARAERRAAWQDIARAIAHEIKNPLTPMRLTTQRLREKFNQHLDGFEEAFLPSTNIVLSEIDRLERLANAFSSFAKMPPPALKPTDLRQVVLSTGDLFSDARDAGRLELIVPPRPISLEVDPEQITQVLLNLIKNGLESVANDDEGRVELRLDADIDPMCVTIDVDDNGPGVPADMRHELFKPYVTAKEDGTGIGLAVVERVVADHSGTVTALDSELGGAKFKVLLPWRTEPVQSSKESPRSGMSATTVAAWLW